MRTAYEQAVDHWLPTIAGWTGFREDAIERSAVHRGLERLTRTGRCLADIAATGESDPSIREALEEAVSVGETYFFREADHFLLTAQEVVPSLVRSGRAKVRAWSAGCSNGAEAFSLAACLRASVPSDVEVEVLGTDLVRRNVDEAERAVFRTHSVRESGPVLFPVLEKTRDGKFGIQRHVREITRFARHNLLDDPGFGTFDLIFCRNVLVYLTADAATRVISHLERCLSAEGVLFLGAADLTAKPTTLVRYAQGAVQIFRRPTSVRPAKASPTRRPRSATPKPAPSSLCAISRDSERAVAKHLVALHHLERGEVKRALALLTEIVAAHGSYVPALLERALVHNRRGEREEALYFMRQVLRGTAALPATDMVAAPEPMPVEFYRRTATAFLERHGEAP